MRESCGDRERWPVISCHVPPEITPVRPWPRRPMYRITGHYPVVHRPVVFREAEQQL